MGLEALGFLCEQEVCQPQMFFGLNGVFGDYSEEPSALRSAARKQNIREEESEDNGDDQGMGEDSLDVTAGAFAQNFAEGADALGANDAVGADGVAAGAEVGSAAFANCGCASVGMINAPVVGDGLDRL